MTQTAELHTTLDSFEQSMSYLASKSVGRIVVSSPEDVSVIPVSYVTDRDCLVFQIPATFRRAISVCERLVFHADGVDPSTAVGWSVTVRGDYSVISAYGVLAPPVGFASAAPLWQQHEEASLWIRLHTDTLDMRESMRFAS